MDRTLFAMGACVALIGCGDPTALDDDAPTPVDAALGLLGIELPPAQGNEEPELPSDNMWDYEVPHDLYDPYPRGGQPLELESIPDDPTVWLVWQSTDELACGPTCQAWTDDWQVQEVFADGAGYPDAFRIKVDPMVPPPEAFQNTRPQNIGVEAGTPALAMAVIFLPTDEVRERYEAGDPELDLAFVHEDQRLGVSDHYLVWLADDVPLNSPAGQRFNRALSAGYHLVPRFRDQRLLCESYDEGVYGFSCGDEELAWLPILSLDDDVGLFTGDWQSVGHTMGWSDEPI